MSQTLKPSLGGEALWGGPKTKFRRRGLRRGRESRPCWSWWVKSERDQNEVLKKSGEQRHKPYLGALWYNIWDTNLIWVHFDPTSMGKQRRSGWRRFVKCEYTGLGCSAVVCCGLRRIGAFQAEWRHWWATGWSGFTKWSKSWKRFRVQGSTTGQRYYWSGTGTRRGRTQRLLLNKRYWCHTKFVNFVFGLSISTLVCNFDFCLQFLLSY